MATQLAFERVTKFYGPVIGVNDVTCTIGPGITGLLGANGAGKSTLLKLASGQLRPAQGRVLVNEHSAWSTAAKRVLGYCPDVNSFYENMRAGDFVLALARLHGYPLREARARTEQALNLVGMQDLARRKLAGCSHGMRQRIKLAQALVHDPQVLLLDEPFTGIDPGGRRELQELIRALARQGKAVLVSTHIMAEVEKLVDRVVVIARGRLIASGSLSEIRRLLADRPQIVLVEAPQIRELAALLIGEPLVQAVELRGPQGAVVRTSSGEQFFATLNALVAQRRIDLHRLETLDSGADAVFQYLRQGAA